MHLPAGATPSLIRSRVYALRSGGMPSASESVRISLAGSIAVSSLKVFQVPLCSLTLAQCKEERNSTGRW